MYIVAFTCAHGYDQSILKHAFSFMFSLLVWCVEDAALFNMAEVLLLVVVVVKAMVEMND